MLTALPLPPLELFHEVTPELVYPSPSPSPDPNELGFIFNQPYNLQNGQMDPAQPQPPPIDYTVVQAMAAAMAQAMQQYMPAPAAVQMTNFDPTKRGVAEPGTFDGSVAKYEEWAIRMRAYCKAAVHHYTSQDCMAFWTQMTSPIASNYAHAKLDFHLANGNWPTIDEVVANLNSRFWPMNNGDWAWKKMQKARQGQSRMDAFLAEFDSWKLMASASDNLAILCLEQAINPEVLCLMHHLGKRKDTYKEYVMELWLVAETLRTTDT
ncbi:hypothetical protein M404DRAFT_24978 [Pisolithus tinctorius Marx 270]|uniref:Retrotransposon gag domain-containing protein n=1 Tax=Pisolithus tinctorius Marx 270 TaxID=870435 RepID=A0A0C3PEH5_PISTI|nr:hypothetical protein M404DRAFT_24978 [Pisolithus tinctorius Marx 270]